MKAYSISAAFVTVAWGWLAFAQTARPAAPVPAPAAAAEKPLVLD